MNLTRCNNGHFYDMDKFDSCPHCVNGASGGAANATVAMAQEGSSAPTADFQAENDGGAVTAPVRIPVVPNINITANEEPTEPVTSSLQNGQALENPKIIPVKSPSTPPDSDISLVDMVNLTVTNHPPIDDQEKTIGIYAVKDKEVSVEPVVGWLVCVKGFAFGQSFILKSGRNFIGRDSSMDVQIPGDNSISRQCHAVILYDPKSKMFLVQPGTSRELFYLNDKVVLGVEVVKVNDVLTIGNTELMFIPCCSENFCWEDQIEKNKEEE